MGTFNLQNHSTMKFRVTTVFMPVLILLSMMSCHKEYDMKKMDKQASIGSNLDIPLVMTDSVCMKDYVKVDLGKISFDADDINFTVPAVPNPSSLPYEQIEEDASSINEMKLIRHFGEPDNFPKWIKELKSICCVADSTIYDVSFKLSGNQLANTVYFKQGMTIKYPDWVHISKCSHPDFKIESSGHIIVLQNSIAVSSDEAFAVKVHIDSFNLPDGSITQDGLEVAGILDVEGKILIKKTDINPTQTETNVKIAVNGTLSDFKIDNATLRLHPEKFNPNPITFSGLSLADMDYSMMDATVHGTVYNPLELSFNISTSIEPEGFQKPADIVAAKKASSDVSVTLKRENGETFNKVDKVSFTMSIVDYHDELITLRPENNVYFTVKYLHTDNGVIMEKK